MYDNGQGVKRNYKEAAKWYRKAAQQGHTTAQYNLGVMYDNGDGVRQDYKEAVKWFQKATQHGDADGQYHLAIMYDRGYGVNVDYIEAYKWLLLAQMNGKDISHLKQILKSKMSPEHIAEAQRLARDFIPKDKPEKTDE